LSEDILLSNNLTSTPLVFSSSLLGYSDNDNVLSMEMRDSTTCEMSESTICEMSESTICEMSESTIAVTQHTTACCSTQVVDIILAEQPSTKITSLRVVQQKHCGSKYKLIVLLLQTKVC
jgi:hypothetical protein